MAKITTSNLDNTINTKLAAAEAANAAVANIVSLAISSVQIADSSYNVLDDTAANTGGGYLVINGTGFTNQSVVIVGTTNATSTTFANTKQLRAQVPALSAATYPVYVVDNVTGATAIKVNGLTYSPFPAWSTGSSLSNQLANTSFSVSLSANSDSSITYSNTTALPAGTTLAANGYFSGTVSIGAQTTYSFDVKATDVENQDVTRTFSLTVTVGPAPGMYSWGVNTSGILGLNDSVARSSPTQVGSSSTWSLVGSTSYTGAFAIKTDGTLWSWGYNDEGRLGLNDRVNKSSPTQIGSLTNWSSIAKGGHQGGAGLIAIKTDGTIWSSGYNAAGALGLNDRVNRSSPVQIGSGTDWSKAAVGSGSVLAIKTNGTLWGWGNGQLAGLGGGSVYGYRSSPTQIGAASNWADVSGRLYGGLGVKTDGTLWSWGTNQNGGAVGNNGVGDPVNITQLGTATNWSSVASGSFVSMARKTDGTLWAWGGNGSGQLGTNDSVSRSSPVQVGTGTNWSTKIMTGGSSTGAIKTDGTLWIWGQGVWGTMGLNDITNRSSPIQVGTGTTWSQFTFVAGDGVIAILTN
jgi:alpha-tubulin suppressor-like RCC1 family protein